MQVTSEDHGITRALHAKANAQLLFPKSIKGHNFVKKYLQRNFPYQIVALVKVNRYIKFHKICINFKVIAKVKVFSRRRLRRRRWQPEWWRNLDFFSLKNRRAKNKRALKLQLTKVLVNTVNPWFNRSVSSPYIAPLHVLVWWICNCKKRSYVRKKIEVWKVVA